uniref:Alpha-L-glutamate ligase-related protein ATP-grasp domain-containing protein n=1 Tax=Haptolina brevifila TaxID=156173 RepID=A0A7S2NKP7_9EUKA
MSTTDDNGVVAAKNGLSKKGSVKSARANSGAPNGGEKGRAKEHDALTAGRVYREVLDAKPVSGRWFSPLDTATRFSLAITCFYRLLITQPISITTFAYRWNTLWYGRFFGLLLTFYVPILPFVLCAVEVMKRINQMMPWAEEDWKMKGPGRVFFERPETLVASLLWDFYLVVSVLVGSYIQYGNDSDGIMHTWYDSICTKEYWFSLLDKVGARRPLQLAAWDGHSAHGVGPGVSHGRCNLVCKISDSYLGIGDKVLVRGKAAGGEFDTLDDLQAILGADSEYKGKAAIAAEFIYPAPDLKLSSEGFGQVHSLDIVTMRTAAGVRVLSVLLWTDCEGWSSHSCTAGYLVDVHSETVVAPTAWYSPYFAKQKSNLLGCVLPGVREACEKACAAHEASTLPWLFAVGWDAMITPDGVVFFEGNVAAYRCPRRMFLTPFLTSLFLKEKGW